MSEIEAHSTRRRSLLQAGGAAVVATGLGGISRLADAALPLLQPGRDDDLIRDIRTLADIEAIQRIKHAYFRCVDTADIAGMAMLLHPQVDMHFIGGTYEWKLSGRAAYLKALGESSNRDVLAQHTGHHPEIDILSPTEATGIWYLHDIFYRFRDMNYTSGTALYRDRYVKEKGRWLIRESRYERLYEIDHKLDQKPAVTASYLARNAR